MLRDNIDFTHNLIKGEIAQIIFEQMFIEMDTAIVLPFGYEHSATVLHQFQRTMDEHDRQDVVNVRNMPDFLLVSQNKDHARLVEVKYRKEKSNSIVKKLAHEIMVRWPSTWLFFATRSGFYFGKCSSIVENNGVIESLSPDLVPVERQHQYLEVMNRYIGEN